MPTRTPLLIAAASSLLLPLAAADPGCQDHGIALDYYLLKDADGALRLSGLAPSARNATEWTTSLGIGPGGAALAKVRLDFPVPDWLLDEAVDPSGKLRYKVQVQQTGPGPAGAQVSVASPTTIVRVRLVEGERSVVLGESHGSYYNYGMWYAYPHPSDIKLAGSYPGHGKGGAPHTHGAGNDASRGLFLSDLAVELEFELRAGGSPIQYPLASYKADFSVLIDGTSFLHLVAVKQDAAPPEPAPAPVAPEESGNGSAGEAGNGTKPPQSAPEAAPLEDVAPIRPRSQSAFTQPLGVTGGAVAALGLAILGVALLVRHRRRDGR